ncbi:MAG TPA: GNAT family N-acetyltransferase [Firmicutes bacterium]|nr:GNAT family N-acetyltransferase [Bacillota bacterium]
MEIKIIDYEDKYIEEYSVCLEDWNNTLQGAGLLKREWMERMNGTGLRSKLALNKEGVVGGMIEYMPVEYSFVEGSNLYFINCIWVHGYEEGRGDFQGEGLGTELLKAAEEDVKTIGSAGILAWGISAPFWMSAIWFEKHGYKEIDREGTRVLLIKKFSEITFQPRWIRNQYKQDLIPGKVRITSFINGQCMSENKVHLTAKAIADEFGEDVVFEEIKTFDKSTMRYYGRKSGLFVNGRDVLRGAPLSYEELKEIIEAEIDSIKKQ